MLIRLAATCAAGFVIFAIFSNIFIAVRYDDRIFEHPADVPQRYAGLLLGTTKLVYGRPNLYYEARIKAAAALYHAKRVRKLLVSGDNSRKEYDEPTDMKRDLIALGVKECDIYLDYAGFRTYDSIIRAKEIFGQKELIIISQSSHCRRALFIAENNGISAYGFAARDIQHPGKLRLILREVLAKIRTGFDVWIFHPQPKFLGDPISITQSQEECNA